MASHEFGHLFGLNHSNRLECENPNGSFAMISNNCDSIEYGGFYSPMSGSWFTADFIPAHFDGVEKSIAMGYGWLNMLNGVKTVTNSGTYQIAPLESAGGPFLPKVLRIARNFRYTKPYHTGPLYSNGWYYLEYRQPSPLTEMTNPAVYSAVAMHLHGSSDSSGSNLNNHSFSIWSGTNEPPDDFSGQYSLIPIGNSYYDPAYGITFTVTETTEQAATVNVSFGQKPPCVVSNPLLVTGNGYSSELLGEMSIAAGGTDTFDMGAVNLDSPACANTTFQLGAVSRPPGWTTSPSAQAIMLAPYGTSTTSFGVTVPSNTPAGDYEILFALRDTSNPNHQDTLLVPVEVTPQ